MEIDFFYKAREQTLLETLQACVTSQLVQLHQATWSYNSCCEILLEARP